MTEEELRADLGRSLEVLAKCSSRAVRGFRAPWFRSLPTHPRRFRLAFHPDYGIGDAPLGNYTLGEHVIDVPMSCAKIGPWRIPCSRGGYFRRFPYALTRALMRRCNADGRPVVFYLHPCEIDPDRPGSAGWGFPSRYGIIATCTRQRSG
jgi:hypothetical protein